MWNRNLYHVEEIIDRPTMFDHGPRPLDLNVNELYLLQGTTSEFQSDDSSVQRLGEATSSPRFLCLVITMNHLWANH